MATRARVDATCGSLLPVTLRLAVPVIVSEFLVSSYGFVDLLFVGMIGRPAAHAAVAALFPLMVLNSALFKVGQIGTMSLVAQYTGARRDDEVKRTISAAFGWALAFSVAVAALGALFAEWIVWPVVPRDPETGGKITAVWEYGVQYLRVIFLGAPLYQLAAIIDGAFKGRGDTITPMVLEGLSLVVNIATTATLTLGLFGAPELGVVGAAIASLVARALVCVLGGVLLWRGRLGLRLPRGWVRWDTRRLGQILRIGVPQGGAILMYFGAMLFVFMFVGELGAPAVSAIGAGIRQIEFVAFTCYLGFNAAAATVVGQCIGAGDMERARRGGWTAAGAAGAVGLMAMIAFGLAPVFLAEALVGATGDAATVEYTKTYIFVVAFSQVPLGIDVALVGAFIGAGRTMFPLVMNFLALSVRVVGVVWCVRFGWGFEAVCWVITGTSIMKGVLMYAAYRLGWWRSASSSRP